VSSSVRIQEVNVSPEFSGKLRQSGPFYADDFFTILFCLAVVNAKVNSWRYEIDFSSWWVKKICKQSTKCKINIHLVWTFT